MAEAAAGSSNAARHHRKEAKKEKRPWTLEETDAVLKGVERWGKGHWSCIKDDPEFGPILSERTTIDIKDKYRNLFAKGRGQSASRTASPVPAKKDANAPSKNTVEDGSSSDAPAPTRQSKRQKSIASSQASEIETKKPLPTRNEEPTPAPFGAAPTLGLPILPMTTDRLMFLSEPMQQPANQLQTSPHAGALTAAPPKPDLLLTLIHDQRSFLVNIKSTAKGAQLLAFAKQEFQLKDDIVLFSEGVKRQLDLGKQLRDQIPLFDIVRVRVKAK